MLLAPPINWEGPEESRPRGYLPAEDNPEADRDANGENLKDPRKRDLSEKDVIFNGTNKDDPDIATGLGDDILKGRSGDDHLDGSEGRDTYIGGKGNDIFAFREGHGRDRVMDFDAVGGVGYQDLLEATFPGDTAITRSGKNTLIDFGDGDVITLIGVKPNQIDETDFFIA